MGAPSGTVTFLFTDIEGSTVRLREVGAERYAVDLMGHRAVIRDAVAAHGGFEMGTEGDAFFVAFVRASEALAAAGMIQEGMAGGAIRVRVGVHTGEPLLIEGDYVGLDVHKAARICSAAHGGQVLVSQTSRDLSDGDLKYLGEFWLKDLAAAERLFQLGMGDFPPPRALGESRGSTLVSMDLESRGDVPGALARTARRTMVGRARELDRIMATWAGQEPALVLVAGEPGVGKTRLAAAAALKAGEEGAQILFGRCDEEAPLPYQPFVEALSTYVAGTPTAVVARQLGTTGHELSRLLPSLSERVGGLRPPTIADPDTERWLLWQAIIDFLRAVAEEQQAVLVIDDLHWAEPATLSMLRQLSKANVAGLRMVATARLQEQTQPDHLGEALADLAREHMVETITLGGLSADDIADLVAERLRRQVDPIFAEAVHYETAGNAFFAHELLSHLTDLGLLSPETDRWPTPAQVEQSGAPEGVQQVLTRRLNQLSDGAQRTLAVAAVAGARFQASDLVGVLDSDLDATIAGLDEATRAGLVAESGQTPGPYHFSHALIRQALYERLSGLRRAQLHWRIGEAIRSIGLTAARLNDLAYHYRMGLAAGDPAVALPWLHQAGDQARQQLAFEEAVDHYRAALDALDRGPDDSDRRYRLLSGLAEAAAAVSDFKTSQDAWLVAAELARAKNDATRFFEAVYGYGTIIRPEDEILDRLVDEALELLGDSDSVERAWLLAWGGARLWRGRRSRPWEEREEMVIEGLVMARRLGDLPAESHALGSLAFVLLGSSRAVDGLTASEENLRITGALGWEREKTWAYRRSALGFIQLGRHADANDAVERALALARAGKRRLDLHNVMMIAVAVAIAEGRFGDARSLVTEVRDIGGHANTSVRHTYGAQLAALYAELGRTDLVINALRSVVDNPSPMTVTWQVMLAGLSADMGRLDEASAELDRLAADHFGVVPRDWAFPLAIRYLAELCAQLNNAERAAELLPQVEPYSGQLLVVTQGTSIEGAADRCLAQLHAVLGHTEQAERFYDAAAELEQAMGYLPLAARTRYWHARLLSYSPDRPTQQRSLQLLESLQTTASQLGMTLLYSQIGQLETRTQSHLTT